MKKLSLSYLLAILAGLGFGLSLSAQTDSQRSRLVDAGIIQVVDLLGGGKTDEATMWLDSMERSDPRNDAVKYYKAVIAMMKDDAPKALQYMEQAYKIDTTNVEYLSQLAYLYFMTDKYALAKDHYSKLLELKPYDADALLRMSQIHMGEGKLEKADSLLARIVQSRGPSQITDLLHVDILRRSPGKEPQFLKELEEYLDNMEDATPADKVDLMERSFVGVASRILDEVPDLLVSLMERQVQRCPTDTSMTHYAAGYFAAMLREDLIDDMIENNPSDAKLQDYCMFVLSLKDDYQGLVDRIVRYVESCGRDRERMALLYSHMGGAYHSLGNLDKAIKCLESSLRATPDHIGYMNDYAYYLALAGKNLEKAERLSRKTVEKEPHNPSYLDTYAYILYRMKKYTLARTYLKRALLYGGKNSKTIVEHYADVLEAMGDQKLAEVYRKQAQKLSDEQ